MPKKTKTVVRNDKRVEVLAGDPLESIKYTDSKGKLHSIKEAGVTQEMIVPFKSQFLITKEGINKLIWANSLNVSIQPGPTLPDTISYIACVDGESYDVGSASEENTKKLGSKYKAETAFKRAKARAVIFHLRMTGVLGEDEIDESQDGAPTAATIKSIKSKSKLLVIYHQIKENESLDPDVKKELLSAVKKKYNEFEENEDSD